MAFLQTTSVTGTLAVTGSTILSGSVLMYGTASLSANPTAAYLRYNSLTDSVEGFPAISSTSGRFSAVTGTVIFANATEFPTGGLGSSEKANIANFTKIYANGSITAGSGTAVHPAFNLGVQPGSGMFYASNNQLAFSVNQVEALRITRNTPYGKIGINEVSPDGLIHASLSTGSADLAKIVIENTTGGNSNASYDLYSVQGLKTRLINVPYNASGFGEWTGGGVLHSSGSTVLSNQSNLHYSAVTHRWYKNAGSGSVDRVMTLDSAGNLAVSGNLTVTGSTVLSGSVLMIGSASLSSQPQAAYILYDSGSDKLVAFPSFVISGSVLPNFITVNTASQGTHRLLINQTDLGNRGIKLVASSGSVEIFGESNNTVVIGATGSYSIGNISSSATSGTMIAGTSLNFRSFDSGNLGGFNFAVSSSTSGFNNVVAQITRTGNIFASGSITGSTAQFTNYIGVSASQVTNVPTGSLTSSTVQGALNELQTEIELQSFPLLITGPEIGLPGWQVLGLGSGAIPVNTSSSYVIPFANSQPIKLTEINFDVTAGSAGALIDVSVWRCENITSSSPIASFIPTTRLYNFTGVNGSVVGTKSVTTGLPLIISGGLHAVVLTSNTELTCSGLLYNAPSFGSARVSSGFQLQVIQGYTANTGYPLTTTWSGSVSATRANGAIGYRGQAAIGWTKP